MATLAQKIEAEQRMRTLLEENGMPAPDAVEYGHTCIRLLFSEPKVCLVVDIEEPPPRWEFVGERLDEGWEEAEEEEDPV